jgi:myo-inositol 2-dehydrogenase/D-chiro-inositol 1-dehydrogenase
MWQEYFIIVASLGATVPDAEAGGGMDGMRVGIIGAGWIAGAHYRLLETLEEAEVTAVCDVDRERAEALTSGTGARVYTDWRELLDREDLDALLVCTPPMSHREPAVAAFDRGLPVYLEKPIARTLADAAAIAEAAERTGAVCAVGYQWHALDLLDELRKLLDRQQIGLLVGTSIGPTQSRPWFLDRRAGGGNLLERGSHHFDLVRAIGGDVVSAQAAASRVRLARSAAGAGDIDDAVTVLLTLASGALATVVVAWTRPGQPGSYGMDVVASESTLRLGLDPEFTLSGMAPGGPVALRSVSPPAERSMRRFLAAARDRDPAAVVCAPPDAAATLAVAIAAERALETAQAVTVPAV